MEENKKPVEIGTIAGAKLSHSGQWLNIIAYTTHNGETIKVICPVRLEWTDGKPSAQVDIVAGKCDISSIKLFEDNPLEGEDPISHRY